MENTLVLENWQIELLKLIQDHIPDVESSEGTSTIESVLDDLDSADPTRFADFADPVGNKTIREYISSILIRNGHDTLQGVDPLQPFARPIGAHDVAQSK